MELIKNLVEGSQSCDSPWPSCHFDEDFILVSEFSELEGPRPLLTIPEDGGGSFNKNTFTVRIMSVDCTAPISSFEAGVEPGDTAFKTVGDTQVVLVEPSEGAIAYVHHFTLYDIHARGFVRPFCMAYVTLQSPKIMSNFTNFREYFSRVSSYFKFGNALVFLQDLHKRHEYLDYTRRKLLENDKPIGSCYQLPFDMKGFNFQTIEDSLKDSNELQNVICAYLNSDIFSEQRELYSHQLESLLQSVDKTKPCIEELDRKFSNFQPRNVGITSGRKFDVQLRTLADLSSPSKQEAFALLQKTYFMLKRTKHLDETNEKEHGAKSSIELHDIQRETTQISTKSKDVFLSATKSCRKTPKSIDSTDFDAKSFVSMSSKHIISDEFNKAWDPYSQWSFSSFSSRHNSFEVIQGAHSSSGDENLSIKDPEISSAISTGSDPSIISVPSSSFQDSRDVSYVVDAFPGTAKRVQPLPTETKGLNAVLNRQMSRGSDDVDSTGSPSLIKMFDKPKASKSIESNDSETTQIVRQHSVLSNNSIKSSSSNTSNSRHHTSNSTKDSRNSPELFDPPPENSKSRHGISLMNLRNRYSFFCHLVYSLMIGRPVVISAEKTNRQRVHCIIVSLLPCIPGFPSNKNSVVFWTTGPFHILSLATVKLVGLAKSRGKDPVPKSVFPYVTVLDFENSTLTAPPYEGTYLNTIFEKHKDWPSASVFLESLHSAQIELSTQAFVMFSLTFADNGTQPRAPGPELRPKQRNSPAMKINPQRFFQFRFPPQDIKIIEHLMEILKDNLRNSYHRALTGDGQDELPRGGFSCIDQSSRQRYCESPSIKLNIMKCQVFSNASGRKK